MQLCRLTEKQESLFYTNRKIGFICNSCDDRVEKVIDFKYSDPDEYTIYFSICENCLAEAFDMIKEKNEQ